MIVSSVTRRSFDAHGKIVSNLIKNEKYSYQGTLTDYANAAEAVAGELNLPFIDLHRASIAHHNKIGREASMTWAGANRVDLRSLQFETFFEELINEWVDLAVELERVERDVAKQRHGD